MANFLEMDDFVHWDKAGDAVGSPFDPEHQRQQGQQGQQGQDDDTMLTDPNLDLVLANVEDDDFSFCALQHFNAQEGQDMLSDTFQFESGADPAPGPSFPDLLPEPLPELWWHTPEKPCAHCVSGGYHCKRISEGHYKGYCTSCVALGCNCSLAPVAPSVTSADLQTQNQTNTPSLLQRPSQSQSQSHTLSRQQNCWPTLDEHPDTVPQEAFASSGLLSTSLSEAAPALPTVSSSENVGFAAPGPNRNSPPPKIGARFSRESVKILKNWLSSHNRHPYPSDEEKEMLQRQTGLNKTQITNWLANARRRGKVQAPRSTSPHVRSSWSGPIDIPRRPGTPAFESNMQHRNPLERWVDSPPENEPASASAIARAVASNSEVSSGLNSPYSFAFTDDGSGRSQCNGSSASSVGTSSNGSWASAYSHASRNSFGSFGSVNQRGRRRRRRRAGPSRADEKTSLAAPLKTFQCTFCTETFRTKHDWQRHEKSLHLSLERWVCAPHGPRILNPSTNQVCCVFCGEIDPDDAHVESHNHSACQERSLEERTFYRKDHLNQHLRLVHDVKFLDWCMKSWKIASPEIRSRCGFCGIVMDSWSIRVDHLAEHFKTGNTMADWKGDWGFEAPVLDMVENSIPPYLIDNERNTPFPFLASSAPPESPRSAYKLIKMELAYFMVNHQDKTGTMPSDVQMQVEACRIIFASEVLSLQGISSNFSWLRDLFMSSDELARQAQFGPMRSAIENRLSILKINGKDNLFEQCPLENQLHEFVRAKRLLGLTAMDDELQQEACRIVGRIEEVSTTPSDFIANWLVKLINSSSDWLANFRQRAHLPRTEDIACIHLRPTDSTKIDSTIHNYSRLEWSLSEYMDAQRAVGVEPTDEDLQRQARITIYEFDDGWNQTAADNVEWLNAFRQRHAQQSATTSAFTAAGAAGLSTQSTSARAPYMVDVTQRLQLDAAAMGTAPHQRPLQGAPGMSSGTTPPRLAGRSYFPLINDANCYRRLARELSRFVVSTMSPNNPNQHVPTDEEMQHQARWILFDDDDPWNQTAADNAEWLERFKRDVGISTATPGPGLEMESNQWSLSQGGTGFAPPYAFPSPNLMAHGMGSAIDGLAHPTATAAAATATTAGSTSGTTPSSFSVMADTNTSAATPTTGGNGQQQTHQTVNNAGSPSGSSKVEVSLRDGSRPFEIDQALLDQYFQTMGTRYERPATVFCSRELEAGLAAFVREEVVAKGGVFPTDETLKARARGILGRDSTAADDDMLLGKFRTWMAGQLKGEGLVVPQQQQQQQQQQHISGAARVEPAALTADINMGLSEAEMDSILAGMSFDVEEAAGGNNQGVGTLTGANRQDAEMGGSSSHLV